MPSAPAARTDNFKLAVFSIIFAVLALSMGDAVIKYFSASFSLWQVYVVRSLIAAPILIAVIKFREPTLSLKPVSISWTAIRSLLLGVMWVAYYAALPHIKLSVAAAVFYTIPLFITLFSAVFTGDKVTSKSWLAIVLGFFGVLLIVRPDADGFNAYVLLPLLAAILYAVAMILTRTKCLDENPKILALSLNITFIGMGIVASLLIAIWDPAESAKNTYPFLIGDWAVLDLSGWLTMSVLAIVVIFGSLFAAIAYQNAPSSVVATFDYSYLAFAALWGLLVFSEVPDALTIVGMVMIAGAGMIAIRE
jgi:drug/metabolite transporter (DMT)-like permease